MKKKILILLLLGFILTGCKKEEIANTITCTYENTKEGTEYKIETKADLNDKDIVINAVSTMTFEHQELADEMCSNYKVVSDAKNVKCEGSVITINKFNKSMKSKGDLTKEEFLEYMDKNNYTCK